MSQLKVSIVVPCYNQGAFLQDCLSAVVRQTYQNWECIIVNDGSSDNTNEVAAIWLRKDLRIRLYEKLNGGLSSARNFGINNSTGGLILPLDADDLICPHYVEGCVKKLTETPDLKLVYGKAIKFGVENGEWKLPDYSLELLLKRNMIFCTAMFYKSDWEKIGGYDEEMKVGWEDWDFWIRLMADGGGVYRESEIMFYYRTKPKSMIKELISSRETKSKLTEYVFTKNVAFYERHFGISDYRVFKERIK
jgi:glycosyltransferase involved in cell wall biosynthesis